jgi:hypothetical protein
VFEDEATAVRRGPRAARELFVDDASEAAAALAPPPNEAAAEPDDDDLGETTAVRDASTAPGKP